jgi:hypothetical protein
MLETLESTSLFKTLNRTLDPTEIYLLQESNKYFAKKEKFSATSLIGFRSKTLSGRLPSRQTLHERYPLTYKSNICPRCELVTETQQHIFSCQKNISVNDEIGEGIRELVSKSFKKRNKKKKKGKEKNEKYTYHMNLDSILRTDLTDALTIRDIALASFPLTFQILDMKTKRKIINYTTEQLYQKVWIPRSSTANTSPDTGIKWTKRNEQPKQLPIPPNNTSNTINKASYTQKKDKSILIPLSDTLLKSINLALENIVNHTNIFVQGQA